MSKGITVSTDGETAALLQAEVVRAMAAETDAAWNCPDHPDQAHLGPNKHEYAEAPAAVTYGIATAGAAATLTDTAQSWSVNGLVDYLVLIVAGTGQGQARTILSNTATVLTIGVNWTTNPDTTSRYVVLGGVPRARSFGAVKQATARGLGVVQVMVEDEANAAQQIAPATAVALPIAWQGMNTLGDSTIGTLLAAGTNVWTTDNATTRLGADLTFATYVTLRATVVSAVASGLVRVAYSTDGGTTWAALSATISTAATGIVRSAVAAVPAAAQGEVLLRIEANTPVGGDVSLRGVRLEFR